MNKREVIWLVIRLVGVYFAYLTLFSFFGLIGSVSGIFSSEPSSEFSANSNTTAPAIKVQPVPYGSNANTVRSDSEEPILTEAEKQAKSDAIKLFFWLVLLTAIYGAATWYLLRDGRHFFALLMREEPLKSAEEKEEVTSLKL